MRKIVSEGKNFVGVIVTIILPCALSTYVGSLANEQSILPSPIPIPVPKSVCILIITILGGLMNLIIKASTVPAYKGLLIPSITNMYTGLDVPGLNAVGKRKDIVILNPMTVHVGLGLGKELGQKIV